MTFFWRLFCHAISFSFLVVNLWIRWIIFWMAFYKMFVLAFYCYITYHADLTTWNSTKFFFYQIYGSRVQLSSAGYSAESQTQGANWLHLHFKSLEKNPFPSSLKLLEVILFQNCWTKIPISLTFVIRSCSSLLEVPPHSLAYGPFHFQSQQWLKELSFASDFSDFCCCCKSEKTSAFKKVHVIRLSTTRYSDWLVQSQLRVTLNYFVESLFATVT